MQYVMLDLSLPLPTAVSDLPQLPDFATLDHTKLAQLPDTRAGISPDLLRFEHFLWLLGELQPGTLTDLPYPWTGLLVLRGDFSGASGRVTILRRNITRHPVSYTELFDLHISLADAADPIRRICPRLSDDQPVVVVLRNSDIVMSGENRFLDRNKHSLAAAAVTMLWCQCHPGRPADALSAN